MKIELLTNKIINDSSTTLGVKSGDLSTYIISSNLKADIFILWEYLQNQIPEVGLTCKIDWVSTWLQYYEDAVNYWFILAVDKNNLPCGLTLVTKETQRNLPIPVKSFHIGTSGESFKDLVRMVNNQVLCLDEFKIDFYKALIKTIKIHFSWEEICFDHYNSNEATYIIKAIRDLNLSYSLEKEPTLFFDLEKARINSSKILDNLSSEIRYTIKRSLKAFDNDITTKWAETESEALEILDEMTIFYNETWKKLDRPGMFASKKFSDFQKEIIKKLIKTNEVILFKAESKKYGTLGCLYLLVDNGVGYGYQLGLNSFDNVEFENINKKRLRTGYILHSLCMQECLDRGFKSYNFSTGIYQYKKDLTNNEDEVVMLSIRKGTKPLLRDQIISLYDYLNKDKKAPKLLVLLRKVINW
jgi:hypothetical protein